MRRILALSLLCSATLSATGSDPNPRGTRADWGQTPTGETATHVLNRIAFGPRPGDVERVRAMGVERYIEQQLRPERIADAEMATRLAGLTTVGMSTREIAEKFERPLLEARRQKK